MKLNELIAQFSIALTNEENDLLNTMSGVRMLSTFSEREQVVIENLIRKSVVTKVHHKTGVLVLVNDTFN